MSSSDVLNTKDTVTAYVKTGFVVTEQPIFTFVLLDKDRLFFEEKRR